MKPATPTTTTTRAHNRPTLRSTQRSQRRFLWPTSASSSASMSRNWRCIDSRFESEGQVLSQSQDALDALHVFPDRPFVLRIAQQECRMIGRHDLDSAEHVETPAQTRDFFLGL